MRTLSLVLLFSAFANFAFAAPADDRLAAFYQRVTGLVPRTSSLNELRGLDENKLFESLFADKAFVENRLASLASVTSNEEAEPFEDVDDFQVSMILAIVNDIDVRDLLTKPYFIESVDEPGKPVAPRNNFDYGTKYRTLKELIEHHRLNFSGKMGAPADGYYSEGLLTTKGFGMRSFKDGTNRRAVRAVYDQFLCTKIETWKDASLDDFYVGQDVDRNPGGNPETYQSVCRGCHAPMDAQRGAVAHYNYDPSRNQVEIAAEVLKKYLQNATVYPEGFVTTDASWENLLTDPASQARFGWRGGREAMRGKGLLSFAAMIANARQFQTCMAQRVVQKFCEKDDLRSVLNQPEFKRIVERFRDGGYKMKALIADVVRSEICR